MKVAVLFLAWLACTPYGWAADEDGEVTAEEQESGEEQGESESSEELPPPIAGSGDGEDVNVDMTDPEAAAQRAAEAEEALKRKAKVEVRQERGKKTEGTKAEGRIREESVVRHSLYRKDGRRLEVDPE